MKRPSIAKRRDRRTGLSPYVRHRKREYLYSPALRNWQSQFRTREAMKRTEEGAHG